MSGQPLGMIFRRSLAAPMATQLQLELGVGAHAKDVDGQNCLAIFPEERIDRFQEDGFKAADGLREFRIEQQFPVKIQPLGKQTVVASHAEPRARNTKRQHGKVRYSFVEYEPS